MGQICGPICGDVDPVHGLDHRGRSAGSYPGHQVTSVDAARKIDQLETELRMLRDDNYRIREEQLRLERDLQDGGFRNRGMGGSSQSMVMQSGRYGSGRPGSQSFVSPAPGGYGASFHMSGNGAGGGPRVDLEQQLTYTNELIRSLQGENQKLKAQIRTGGDTSAAGVGGGAGGVDEAQYQQVRTRLAQLQQQQSVGQSMGQNAGQNMPGQLPGRSSFPAAPNTAGLVGRGSFAQLHHGQSFAGDYLAQLRALEREQEQLRGKVRKLAHNQ